MAEATGLRNSALPYPIYGVPYGVKFPLRDGNGDLVTGASSLDSERSLNGDTFADCTNEATEIATNSGMYYLLLTAAEMTADVVGVIVKSGNAKTQDLELYPRKLPALLSNTAQAGASGSITLNSGASAVDGIFTGCIVVTTGGTGSGQARVISGYVGSTKVASVSPNWATTPDNTTTFTVYLPEGRQVTSSELQAIAGAAVSTSSAQLGVNVVNAGGTAWATVVTNLVSSIWSAGTRVLTAGTNIVLAKGTGITGLNDLDAAGIRSAIGLASANLDTQISGIAAAVWDRLTSALTTVGSIGKLIVDNLNAAITSRLASGSYTAPLDAAGTRAALGLAAADLDTQLAAKATPADVNAQVLDVLNVDTFGEPAQGEPPSTATIAYKLAFLYKLARNKKEQTASQFSLYNDAGNVVDHKSAVSDNGTTATRGEFLTGP